MCPTVPEGWGEVAPEGAAPPAFVLPALAKGSAAHLGGAARFSARYLASVKLLRPTGTAASAPSCPAVSVVSDASTRVDSLSDAHAIGQGLLAVRQRPIRSESRILKRSADNVNVRERRAALIFAGWRMIRRHLIGERDIELREGARIEARCYRRRRKHGTDAMGGRAENTMRLLGWNTRLILAGGLSSAVTDDECIALAGCQ